MKTKTHEEYISELETKNKNVLILGKYINKRTRIETQCKSCGRIWMARPNDLLVGGKCLYCAAKSRRKTHDEFIAELNNINSNIEILSTYKVIMKKFSANAK